MVPVPLRVTPDRAHTGGRELVQRQPVRKLGRHVGKTAAKALVSKRNPSSNEYFTGFLENNHRMKSPQFIGIQQS